MSASVNATINQIRSTRATKTKWDNLTYDERRAVLPELGEDPKTDEIIAVIDRVRDRMRRKPRAKTA